MRKETLAKQAYQIYAKSVQSSHKWEELSQKEQSAWCSAVVYINNRLVEKIADKSGILATLTRNLDGFSEQISATKALIDEVKDSFWAY